MSGVKMLHTCIYWCIPVYTGVYLCILVYTCVYWCIPMYTGVYLCILVYTCVCGVYLCMWCIPVYTGVYLYIPVYVVYICVYLCMWCIPVYTCVCGVYLCIPVYVVYTCVYCVAIYTFILKYTSVLVCSSVYIYQYILFSYKLQPYTNVCILVYQYTQK